MAKGMLRNGAKDIDYKDLVMESNVALELVKTPVGYAPALLVHSSKNKMTGRWVRICGSSIGDLFTVPEGV